jgi:hypothetical protein
MSIPPVNIPNPTTPEEKEEMRFNAEKTLLPLLPENLHCCIKYIDWNPHGLFYFHSMAKLRLQLKKESTNWRDFVKTTKDINPIEFAGKCIYDPYTRFLLEDVDGFKDWLVEQGVVNKQYLNLLFDRRLISDKKEDFDSIVKDIEEAKLAKH